MRLAEDGEDAFVKFLLPNFLCGVIIGSAGGTVSRLMESTNTMIKFSPGRELYPGTSDRVCLVTGLIPNICEAVRMIFNTMTQSAKSDEVQESLKRFRMIVSNIASGMVIGKAGSTIRSIQMECGVKMQITNKVDNALPERLLTINGETEGILSALEKILSHTLDDPDLGKWKRLMTYSGYSSSVPTAANMAPHPMASAAAKSSSRSGGGLPGHSQSMAYPASNSSTDPTAAFMAFFAQQQQAQQVQQQQQQQQAYSAYAQGGTQGATPNNFNQALMSYAYAQSLVTNNSSYYSQAQPVMVDGVNLTVPGATVSTYEIAVPEWMVPAITGSDNKMLTELMRSSGSRIQLSGKGEFIPGTFNRKLTMTGPILSVQSAHMIILQKLLKEQENYQKHGI